MSLAPVSICPHCGGLDGSHSLTCETEYDKIRAIRGKLEPREVEVRLKLLVATENVTPQELVTWIAQHLKDRLDIPENPGRHADYYYVMGASVREVKSG